MHGNGDHDCKPARVSELGFPDPEGRSDFRVSVSVTHRIFIGQHSDFCILKESSHSFSDDLELRASAEGASPKHMLWQAAGRDKLKEEATR